MDLSQIIGTSLFAFLLVFVRLGAAFLLMPGIGEQFISPRIRLLFTLALALLVTPVVAPTMPPMPTAFAATVALVAAETLVGAFIGTVARMMMSALEVAGHFIATQVGLSAAQAFNPTLAAPSTPIGALLGIVALMMIFATDLHHMLILGVVDSYQLFPPGQWLPPGDTAQVMTSIVSRSFVIGLQMAAPFIVLGLLFYLGLGMVSRLVPSIQVFFVGVPIQTLMGLLLLGISMTAVMIFWLRGFEAQMIQFLGR
ncbi:MAG: hypothetical protein RLY86_3358 [Pseudomonadota bacterium]|jgi:flagellar biosynthetic protein FliR